MTDAGLGALTRRRPASPVSTERRSLTRRALDQKPSPPTWRDRFLSFDWFKFLRRTFLLVVALPTAITAAYYLFIAAPTYTAEAQFAVRPAADRPLLESYLDADAFDLMPSPTGERMKSNDSAAEKADGGGAAPEKKGGSAASESTTKNLKSGGGSQTSQIASLALSAVGNSKQDDGSFVLAAFISSQTIVNALNEDGWLKARFSAGNPDWFQGPPSSGAQEDLWQYWRHVAIPKFDTNSGIIDMTVTAFTPEDALAIAQHVVAQSEALINRLSERSRQDRLAVAKQEIETAEQRFMKAEAGLRAFRSQQSQVNPTKVAASIYTQVLDLLSARIALDVQLRMMGPGINANAPQVKSLKLRIAALDKEIDKAKADLTDKNGSPNAASHFLGQFEALETERLAAETLYSSALDEMDQARLETERQGYYLAQFIAPTLPLSATGPAVWKRTATMFLMTFILWGIGATLIAAGRDHLS